MITKWVWIDPPVNSNNRLVGDWRAERHIYRESYPSYCGVVDPWFVRSSLVDGGTPNKWYIAAFATDGTDDKADFETAAAIATVRYPGSGK